MDHTKQKQTIAYFSMEIGLPTLQWRLGVLAGDTIRAAADLNVPLVAMTLLHRKGYFHQRLDASGWQSEEPVQWVVEDFLAEVSPRVAVPIEERTVQLRSWKFIGAVHKQCVFTTHTPVPAGHDKFPMDLVTRVLGLLYLDLGIAILQANHTLTIISMRVWPACASDRHGSPPPSRSSL